MKIKFIKEHLGYKAGETADVADGLGKYLVRVQAAEIASKEGDGVVKEVKKSPVKKAKK